VSTWRNSVRHCVTSWITDRANVGSCMSPRKTNLLGRVSNNTLKGGAANT